MPTLEATRRGDDIERPLAFGYGESHRWLADIAQDATMSELVRDLAAEAGAQELAAHVLARKLHLSNAGLEKFMLTGEFRYKATISHVAGFLRITEDEARSKLPLPFCQCAWHCGKRVQTPGAKFVRGHGRRGLVKYTQADGRSVWMYPFDPKGRPRGYIKGHQPPGNKGSHALALAKLKARAEDPSLEPLMQDLARKAVSEEMSLPDVARRIGVKYGVLRALVFGRRRGGRVYAGFPAPKTMAKICDYLEISVATGGTRFRSGSYDKARLDSGILTGSQTYKRKALQKRIPLPELMEDKGHDMYERYRRKHLGRPPPSRKGEKLSLAQRRRLSITRTVRAFRADVSNWRNRTGDFVRCLWCGKLVYRKSVRSWHGACYLAFQRQLGSRPVEEQEEWKRNVRWTRLPENVSQRVVAWLLVKVLHVSPTMLAGLGHEYGPVRSWIHEIEKLIPATWTDLFPGCSPLLRDELIRADWFPPGTRHYAHLDPAGLLDDTAPDEGGGPAFNSAKALLRSRVSNGQWVAVEELKGEVELAGFEWPTMLQAKKALGLVSSKRRVENGGWEWHQRGSRRPPQNRGR